MTLEIVASDGYPFMPPVVKFLQRVSAVLVSLILLCFSMFERGNVEGTTRSDTNQILHNHDFSQQLR